MADDQTPDGRDLRVALIFGIAAATLELAALLYFWR